MGDKGTSTHMLAEHKKVESELEELPLTKSVKSKQRLLKTKTSSQEIIQRDLAKEFMWKRTSRLTWSSYLLNPIW